MLVDIDIDRINNNKAATELCVVADLIGLLGQEKALKIVELIKNNQVRNVSINYGEVK